MTCREVHVRPNSYVDSVVLMEATRVMENAPGVEWAAAFMGTPAQVETLISEGFDPGSLSGIGANDVVLAVRAAGAECTEALKGAETVLSQAGKVQETQTSQQAPRSLEEARAILPDANVAIISVPGPFAALEAHKALNAGLHVLLFSDNVSLEEEIALKEHATRAGCFVMGPGAGTAMLGHVGLGFANVVAQGRVGVAAAAGTGAQEVMSLLDRWGAGVSHVIGVGGRDLSRDVGGRMMRLALLSLESDPETDVLLVVSKPPAADVARSLFAGAGRKKPVVAALIGLHEMIGVPESVTLTSTLEDAVRTCLQTLGIEPPPEEDPAAAVANAARRLPDERRTVRGLFSGGTLCYESMYLLGGRLGPIYSNTPLQKEWGLPAPAGSHICLDLGEEEYTRGRPHPMIDPGPRAKLIAEAGDEEDVAVILIDVVLGYGSHPDPASILAPACAEAMNGTSGAAVVAYVLGTHGDPQGYDNQCRQLREAGCLVAPTGRQAALAAAALASRGAHIGQSLA